jgi:hypothetical protein
MTMASRPRAESGFLGPAFLGMYLDLFPRAYLSGKP